MNSQTAGLQRRLRESDSVSTTKPALLNSRTYFA